MLNEILISDAAAQAVEVTEVINGQGKTSFMDFFPVIVVFVIFYFVIIRPQSKKAKEHKAMIDGLKNGNKVVTSGGIIGVVKDILLKENQVEIEISEGVSIKILRQHIVDLIKEEVAVASVKKHKNK